MTTPEPAAETAVTQEPPGAAEPDAAAPGEAQDSSEDGPEPALDAAPGFEQDGPAEGPEPALDEAAKTAPAEAGPITEAEALAPYDFAEHGRRVFAPWPSVGQPRIMTADSRKAWRDAETAAAQAWDAAFAEIDRAHRDALQAVHGRLDDYLLMRTKRFPVLTG